LLRQAAKDYGPGKVQHAVESNCSYMVRRPCGIFSLDLATFGGLPVGSMAEVAGDEGIGKNYLANQYIRMCQHIFKDEARIFVAVSEYKYDKLFARMHGVKVALSPEELGEMEESLGAPLLKSEKSELMSQVGEIVLIQQMRAEHTLQAVLDFLMSGAFHLGVLDSLGAMAPISEATKKLDKASGVGRKSALQTRFMDQFYYCVGGTQTLFLVLNQVRAAIGEYVPHGRMTPARYNIPESHSVKHGLVGRLILSHGGNVYEDSGPPDEEPKKKKKGARPIGKRVRWELTKGKQGFHEGANGEWIYDYRMGVDRFSDFINVAISDAKRSGAYYTFMGQQFQGREEFEAYFRDRQDRIEEAQAYIYKERGVRYLWR